MSDKLAARRLNGRPEAEVIVNFGDGHAYSKAKLESALTTVLGDSKSQPKAIKHASQLKKEDIELIVSELEIPRSQAERALANADGDVQLALRTLVTGSSE
ncbi:hypothetical protein PENSPDRAFT_592488 [Peniophora sp. CONT]|nr:hypothetical protein PENSPDRAFT_592488 [Peniophora sp. CONT]